MKKIIFGALLLASVLVVTQTAMGGSLLKSAQFATDTKLQVFGQTVETDIVTAQKAGVNGTTNYVSARDLAQHLGYDVLWNGKTRTISVGLFPTDGVSVSDEKYAQIDQFKKDLQPMIDEFKNKFSTRELDNLNKSMAYLLHALDGDIALLTLLMADDYHGYMTGADVAFADIWTGLKTATE